MATAPQPQMERRTRPSLFWLFVALIPLVALRRELGYQLVHPVRLLFASVLVVALPHAINLFYQQPLNTPVLVVLAFIFVVLGLRHRWLHGRELAAGTSRVHTLETGLPHVVAVFPLMPLWLAACVVDPLLCIGAGYLTTYISAPCGVAVMVCGIALGSVEIQAYAEQRRRFLQTHDGMREAERHGGMAAHHAERSRRGPARAQSTGTPAGAGDDVFELHLSRQRD